MQQTPEKETAARKRRSIQTAQAWAGCDCIMAAAGTPVNLLTAALLSLAVAQGSLCRGAVPGANLAVQEAFLAGTSLRCKVDFGIISQGGAEGPQTTLAYSGRWVRTNTNRQSGNVARASRTFAEHGVFIRQVLQCAVADSSLVEDFYQELFVYLVRNPIPEDRLCRGYLYRVIMSRVAEGYRRDKSYLRMLDSLRQMREQRVAATGPLDNLVDGEAAHQMFDLVERRLSARQARAIHLRYQQNMDPPEAAAAMGVDTRTISKYTSRGLRRLREFFTGRDGGEL